jgi:hypothetical protein
MNRKQGEKAFTSYFPNVCVRTAFEEETHE